MIRKFIKYFTSDNLNSFEQEANNCLKQINDYLQINNLNSNNILSISIFIRTDGYEHFNRNKMLLLRLAIDLFDLMTPFTFISQAPFQNNIACELIVGKGAYHIIDKNYGNINYRIIDFENYKEIYSSGIETELKHISTLENSEFVFNEIGELLKIENMNFPNIVRQWNYIEGILNFELSENNKLQNYQALNDTRTKFYSFSKWIDGYPAATGIGMNAGKIAINFIAVQNNEKMKMFPLHNPIQIDAHKYSENVLVSNNQNDKQTPKFERGKIIFYDNNIDLYVSGTAAIEGENTIKSIDVAKQTEFTFENIKKLISKNNLNKNLPKDYSKKIINEIKLKNFSNFRIYVKNESDIEKVKIICKKYIRNAPAIYLVADICREDLLVEIEGSIFITNV